MKYCSILANTETRNFKNLLLDIERVAFYKIELDSFVKEVNTFFKSKNITVYLDRCAYNLSTISKKPRGVFFEILFADNKKNKSQDKEFYQELFTEFGNYLKLDKYVSDSKRVGNFGYCELELIVNKRKNIPPVWSVSLWLDYFVDEINKDVVEAFK